VQSSVAAKHGLQLAFAEADNSGLTCAGSLTNNNGHDMQRCTIRPVKPSKLAAGTTAKAPSQPLIGILYRTEDYNHASACYGKDFLLAGGTETCLFDQDQALFFFFENDGLHVLRVMISADAGRIYMAVVSQSAADVSPMHLWSKQE
jgi:hypothetical protein